MQIPTYTKEAPLAHSDKQPTTAVPATMEPAKVNYFTFIIISAPRHQLQQPLIHSCKLTVNHRRARVNTTWLENINAITKLCKITKAYGNEDNGVQVLPKDDETDSEEDDDSYYEDDNDEEMKKTKKSEKKTEIKKETVKVLFVY